MKIKIVKFNNTWLVAARDSNWKEKVRLFHYKADALTFASSLDRDLTLFDAVMFDMPSHISLKLKFDGQIWNKEGLIV